MPIKTKKRVVLYGTLGCHLCDNAQKVLQQAQCVIPLIWHTVDIALDQNLMTQYALSIPIIKLETGQLLKWPFSVLDIQGLQNT